MNATRARQLLKAFDFRTLFIDELGWDQYMASLEISIEGRPFRLMALAHKRGMVVYHCALSSGERIPEYYLRRKIEHHVAKAVHEHLIIFTDAKGTTQIWQWVKREPGKPVACREHMLHTSQHGEALLQKLQAIAFTLDEEDTLSLSGVTRRAQSGFDVESVTKRFYDRFQKEHKVFLKFITGIPNATHHEWYTSVMLNRLMFVYFIQRKGFLDGDLDYLRHRLKRCREEKGNNQFYSFYRYFLLRLFHEGLGGKSRSPALEKLLGKIPYLNGGLFEKHAIEQGYTDIQIPDKAFERIFDYFDRYQWHLDDRPLREDNEINPDVLGYIFEKYINQKQMGAYYTKEDITEYISKHTVLPYLFHAARTACLIAFENPGGPTVWDLLRERPDRYIYPALLHGAGIPLPHNIAAGIETVGNRTEWNKPAPVAYALPTEIWREVVMRRKRYTEIRQRLVANEVQNINDLTTLNLDIRQFAQDTIENCGGPDLLRAFWHAIERVTILDPTCGSGAFLFAALNILEPLYEACLDRMETFIADLDLSRENQRTEKFSDFREILASVRAHPNRRYFILKSIILNNLFGVDIMEEAVEICKLRLFLKLASQVEPNTSKSNLGIEPLPDIDFNIRTGNTLVGYVSYDEVQNAVGSKLDFDRVLEKIKLKAVDVQQTFDSFRQCQTEADGPLPTEHKMELHKRLKALEEELNRYIAADYKIDVIKKGAFDRWLRSHRPFHWFIEFYGIINGGGFDVIIGNPPWKEYAAVKSQYTVRNYCTEKSGNLYALCVERSLQLLAPERYLSFIVQLPLVSSSRMAIPRQHLAENCTDLNVIPCDDRPGKLFEGLQNCRSTIFIARKRREISQLYFATTRYNRWPTEARSSLFATLEFTQISELALLQDQFPKIAATLLASAFKKLFIGNRIPVQQILSPRSTNNFIFYQEATRYWIKATDGLPYYAKNGSAGIPAHGRYLYFRSAEEARIVCAILNSTLFYSYFVTYGDCFHLSDALATRFPVPPEIFADKTLSKINVELMRDLKKHAVRQSINTKDGDKISYDGFRVSESKDILDRIDRVLAQHYNFTEDELDFIINYDIKYRMSGISEGDHADGIG